MSGRKRPNDIETQEEMEQYLNANQEYEYPLVIEAWEKAVESTRVANEKIRESNAKSKSGKLKPYVKVGGRYFQLVALPQFSKIGQELKDRNMRILRDEKEREAIEELIDSNTDEGEFIQELMSTYFTTIVDAESVKFAVSRLSDYYTNYEFNEGSDKFLVVSAVADELALRELYSDRAKGSDVEKRIKDTRESYMKALSGLKVLKSDKKDDYSKSKFTAFVDDLTRTGELNTITIKYKKDQIDELIEATERSIVGAYHG